MTDNEIIAKLKELLQPISTKLDDNSERLNRLENKVTGLQLTLENETNKSIKIIAEGHLDLSRKLDEALKVENEKEMLMLRVNILENEVQRLKAKIEQIA